MSGYARLYAPHQNFIQHMVHSAPVSVYGLKISSWGAGRGF